MYEVAGQLRLSGPTNTNLQCIYFNDHTQHTQAEKNKGPLVLPLGRLTLLINPPAYLA